ncbi:RWD domain-containing protein 3 isoform 5 [Camelus ferus]|nr:RWD domain-containing protein 3 isoform 5 [Camelus ferus]
MDADISLQLVFHLPVNYPSCLPGVVVNSEHLTRAQCLTVKEKLLEQAESLLSEPMVHELVLWIQQNLRHVLKQPETGSGSEKCTSTVSTTADDGLWITLLHLDHMRAKTKYVKTVEKWASDLRLTGRLMFMALASTLCIQGCKDTVTLAAWFGKQEYLILQKTSKVDVDSSGKKCKEKMISVLFETKVQTEHKRVLMMFSWRTGKCSQVVLREGDFSGLRSHKEPAPAAAASEAVVIEPGSTGMVLPQMELQLLAVGSQSHSTPVVPPQQLPATARALGLCLPSNTPTWPSPTAISRQGAGTLPSQQHPHLAKPNSNTIGQEGWEM